MFTQDMSTHGNFERLTHLPFAPPINMKALSNVRQRTANGLPNGEVWYSKFAQRTPLGCYAL